MQKNNIEIIKSDRKFSKENMLSSMMIYGFYCYHEESLKDLVPKNIEWKESFISYDSFYGVSVCEKSSKKFFEKEFPKYQEIFPNLIFLESTIYCGLDRNVGDWHTDEDLKMQVLCYQSDLNELDGGELQLKCYDGTERHYYPKNGDIIIMNHMQNLPHKVGKLLSDNKRTVINLVFI